MSLTKGEIVQYHEDGYVLAKQVISPNQLSKLQEMTYRVAGSQFVRIMDDTMSVHSRCRDTVFSAIGHSAPTIVAFDT